MADLIPLIGDLADIPSPSSLAMLANITRAVESTEISMHGLRDAEINKELWTSHRSNKNCNTT